MFCFKNYFVNGSAVTVELLGMVGVDSAFKTLCSYNNHDSD